MERYYVYTLQSTYHVNIVCVVYIIFICIEIDNLVVRTYASELFEIDARKNSPTLFCACALFFHMTDI